MRWDEYLQIAGTSTEELILLDDPFEGTDSVSEWSGDPRASKRHFRVNCTDLAHLDDLAALFSGLSTGPVGWTIALPDSGRPVDLLWPLRIGVAGKDTAPVLEYIQQQMTRRSWMRTLVSVSQAPAGQGGSLDIAIFPDADTAMETLYSSPLPVKASALLLLSDPSRDLPTLTSLMELVSMTHAQAVLLADPILLRTGSDWLVRFVEELSHDMPWHEAALAASRFAGVDARRLAMLATQRFLDESRLSRKTELVLKRIAQTPPRDESVDSGREVIYSHGGDGGSQWGAVEQELRNPDFHSERRTASTLAEAAQQVPDQPAATAERFVQARVSVKVDEAALDTIEAGKDYVLQVRIGTGQGWTTSHDPLPEPPLKPQETSVILTVLFHEPHSCPDGLLRTIELPRSGPSSTAEFPVRANTGSAVLDGRITIYHNNRPLMECAYRVPVMGGAAIPALTCPGLETLMRTRRFDGGLDIHQPAAGTLRVEGEDVHIVRGLRKTRVSLGGIKQALARMEKAINSVALEDIDASHVMTSDPAARLVVELARQGYHLHDALTSERLMKDILASPGILTVLAADTSTRVPLELCYSFEEPSSDAVLCPDSLRAVSKGRCIETCAGSKDPEHHVCPMGFWGMQRAIEWRGREADAANESAPVAPTHDRQSLAPLREVLYAHSKRVEAVGRLKLALEQQYVPATGVRSWKEWAAAVKQKSPSLLILMPHVDRQKAPPEMEIGGQVKDPPGVKDKDVVNGEGESPVVLILGCGAATFTIDFQSLPSQFRRRRAAVVIAPMAEILASDAPQLGATFVSGFGTADDTPLGETILACKRAAVASGLLSGLLLLSFGDADWRVSAC
ncbi:MAG: hypothetical protein HY820_11410 [Acidobacteria bacterium]|nr:hypothetical protein [Acidobacteriota bacterium]